MLLFVNQLTNSDFSFLHPQRGLLGETWLSDIELEGALDDQGMVCDFGIVKATVRQLLDDLIDHRLLVPKQAPNLTRADIEQGVIQLDWALDPKQGDAGERIQLSCPESAVTLIDAGTISPDSVAHWCQQRLQDLLPDTLESIRIGFSTESIAGPYYHYSHGLKKHRGKCQRIAHGHRSKIIIHKNGERDKALEADWAEKFQDIFIGTLEDKVQTPEINNNIEFRYQAPEGNFALSLPRAHCYCIDRESTVEHIAAHIAGELKKRYPGDTIEVRAFEGIAKGAVVSR